MTESRCLTLMTVLVVLAAGPRGAVGQTVHEVAAGESLSTIAARAYDDGRAWPAIMLATNSRQAELCELKLDPKRFIFIVDPNSIRPRQQVWLPNADEKVRWMRHYRAYVAAVLDMALPQPWEISRRLVSIPLDAPVRVVSWARANQYSVGRAKAKDPIWVTKSPHLQDFCRSLKDRSELVTRLEQRLGLPPASNKTEFVELTVANPAKDLFRPCADPRIDTTTCPLGPPGENAPEEHREHRDWFLNQYFISYAEAHPTRYPWTSLGYTYDWGDSRSEEGEAEFVIRPRADIKVESITSTEQYCSVDISP